MSRSLITRCRSWRLAAAFSNQSLAGRNPVMDEIAQLQNSSAASGASSHRCEDYANSPKASYSPVSRAGGLTRSRDSLSEWKAR